jgi:hypothetical protein
MKYEGLIVVCLTTGKVVGGYPSAGDAEYYTRVGIFGDGEKPAGLDEHENELGARLRNNGYAIVRVSGEAGAV